MSTIPQGTPSYRKRNPQLFQGFNGEEVPQIKAIETAKWSDYTPQESKPPKRIRQSSKPTMNKLEEAWFNRVSSQNPNYPRPRAHSLTFKLANGVTYCPDVFVSEWPVIGECAKPTAWEVKGKKAWDDAIVKLKVAAHEWPEIRWVLVWKDSRDGGWREQTILP